MNNPVAAAQDLLTGRWRSQILHAGVKLGIVDAVAGGQAEATTVAGQLDLDATNTYRLMRGLASIGVLVENGDGQFDLTDMGACFTTEHPNSMRGVCLWEEGAPMYAAWRHLPDVVRDGGDDGFIREFGMPVFAKITSDAEVGALFNAAMTSYSMAETGQVLAALDGLDTGAMTHVCDIGGGRGHLLCTFLAAHTHLQGTVLDLPETVADPDVLLAAEMGVGDRCQYVAGDMFAAVPGADAYLLKHILHDWNDDECVSILRRAHEASPSHARVFVAEYVVPGPDQPDFAKLFDIHMMSVLTGRERTEREYADLYEASGWRHVKTWSQPLSSMAVVEAVKA